MVGLIQQFMIKYGQIGIPIPFTDIIFNLLRQLSSIHHAFNGDCVAHFAERTFGKAGLSYEQKQIIPKSK